MSISENLKTFKKALPESVTVVAVSKTKPASDITEAYETGHRDFGENKVQEMEAKWETLPKDIRWHMIGHVQRNKVKYMAPFVHLIHSIDSPRLLKEINKQGKKIDRVIHGLLQIKIAEEDSKFGLDIADAEALLASEAYQQYQHVKIVGLMGMATFTDDTEQIKREFEQLKRVYDRLKEPHSFHTLSMGMSGDYSIALELGTTMVRVGSAIFGARNYS